MNREPEPARLLNLSPTRFPRQHQSPPGLESRLRPRTALPGAELPRRRQARGQGRVDLRWRFRHRPRRCRDLRPRGRRCGAGLSSEEESDARATRDVIEGIGRRCLMLPGGRLPTRRSAILSSRRPSASWAASTFSCRTPRTRAARSLDEVTDEGSIAGSGPRHLRLFWLARAAIPHLKRGSSDHCDELGDGSGARRGAADYSATKGAINAFTKTLAQQLQDRIRMRATPSPPARYGRRSIRPIRG